MGEVVSGLNGRAVLLQYQHTGHIRQVSLVRLYRDRAESGVQVDYIGRVGCHIHRMIVAVVAADAAAERFLLSVASAP